MCAVRNNLAPDRKHEGCNSELVGVGVVGGAVVGLMLVVIVVLLKTVVVIVELLIRVFCVEASDKDVVSAVSGFAGYSVVSLAGVNVVVSCFVAPTSEGLGYVVVGVSDGRAVAAVDHDGPLVDVTVGSGLSFVLVGVVSASEKNVPEVDTDVARRCVDVATMVSAERSVLLLVDEGECDVVGANI